MKNKNFFSVIIVGISTFLAGILGYLYHPVMVRYLDMKEFAEFESLLGVINLLGVFISGFALFIVKELTNFKDDSNKKIFLKIIRKILIYLSLILFFIFLLFSSFLANFLKIENYVLILLVGIIFFLGNYGYYYYIISQAERKFTTISILNVLNPFLKLFFGYVLVVLGFSLYGAIGGLLIAQILTIFIWIFILKNNYKKEESLEKESILIEKNIKNNFLKQKKQIFHFTFSTIILALFMNIDIILAKNIFSSEEAGVYAGISIIAKFLVFVGMSIETVYYPVFIAENKINKKKISILSILYVSMTFSAIIFFYLFGEYILYFFKPGFENYLDLLYLLLIYCGILSLLNFLVKILVAFEKYFINYFLLFFLILFVLFIYFFTNNSFYNFINIFNALIFISVFSSFIYLLLIKNEK